MKRLLITAFAIIVLVTPTSCALRKGATIEKGKREESLVEKLEKLNGELEKFEEKESKD